MPSQPFPRDFLFGAAMSSHQVEGANALNDWWAWEEAGRVAERSGSACDHWHRFREDFELAAGLGHNAHRFSLEWSRLEPEAGVWDDRAFDHYREVLEALRHKGLEPIVTLNHFTLPQWAASQGGWMSEAVITRFDAFAREAARRFGELARYWITVNEPMVYAYKSYVEGTWPPGTRDFEAARKVVRGQLFAHARAYVGLHEEARRLGRAAPRVSLAHHVITFAPCRAVSPLDHFAVWARRSLATWFFLKSCWTGQVAFPGAPTETLPAPRTLDFVGVNYYSRDFIHFDGVRIPQSIGKVCTQEHHRDAGPRNDMGWEIYPQGLYLELKRLASLGLPLMVTENGICTGKDEVRAEFIKTHLAAVRRAMAEGVPVLGYLYWSLLDNFEWADGFGPRFGLVEVDYKTQRRTVRESARVFAEICGAH